MERRSLLCMAGSLLVILLLSTAAGGQLIGPRRLVTPQKPMGISGMVRIGENEFLTVNDKKHSDSPDHNQPGARLGVLTVTEHGVSTRELSLANLGDADPPSDLEAACAVPGRANEYLLAESGYYHGDFGRVFHIRAVQEEDDWNATVLGMFSPFGKPADRDEYTTPKTDQIEGMSCLRTSGDELLLVLARRGGTSAPAEIVWGTLDGLGSPEPSFVQLGGAALTTDPGPLAGRGAAGLRLIEAGVDAWRVWSVASIDAGDMGPFRSVIYGAGELSWDRWSGLQFSRTPVKVLWTIDGLKVEAVADPAELIDDSVLSIGTDDEAYGPLWRPLFWQTGR